ncbi:MAG: preprotein translocase subunit SecA [Flavobacteriaceae bacterium]|jgi:preprotein translocase subunit SecA|nr:preprotein translocase subunit SecA [Flavobacteriaceae bacterium]MBT4062470.1 preprotein translocase subunit SecA [Flavobacteriaceae bacterium]MBT4414825.1 preprotein translocase subunit SecA [Flavobacteriaceae bacterium]MBT5395457.1 preprotein translocase subunit SecA [Flavobacteriaceae bacterium]MBT5595674.1 preprotein translocase subunit SecA [Flavobacteriaceae bacterium]
MSLINSILNVFVGSKSKKDLKEVDGIVKEVLSFESALSSLNHDELRNKTIEFKDKIQLVRTPFNEKVLELKNRIDSSNNIDEKDELFQEIDSVLETSNSKVDEMLNEMLPEAFAVVKETAKRFKENSEIMVKASSFDMNLSSEKAYISIKGENAIWLNKWDAAGKEVTWDMVHYDVQLIGGIALHRGKIAEMHTGEGKTLVATLPVYLNALTGNGVHLVTVNDYLAKRDSAWMAPIFEFHGLSIDCIDHYSPNSEGRKKAYNSDVTYGTNNEFGFDYLRDNMAHSSSDLVQTKRSYAIVDEVDSVLIDDARTPLIISGPVPKGDIHEFNELKPKVHSIVQKQKQLLIQVLSKAKKLISEGNKEDGGFHLLQVYRGLPKNSALIKYLSEEGVKQLLQKTENFYMQDNNREMPKVDSGLYFVIDEKNNQIELTDKGIDNISDNKDDSHFFVLPNLSIELAEIENKKLDVNKEVEEKEKVYNDFAIKSERIHTLNQLLKAYTLFEKDTEYVIMDNKVKIVDEQTGRIMDGRRYSDGLHQAIEAKENVKIEDATQTFASVTLQNYFRMYTKLSGMTGTAITEAGEFWDIYKLDVVEIPTNKPIARKDHNDLIYKTKREKYNAVIEDVVKVSKEGRPVLIGTTSVEISELLARMLSIKQIKHNVLNAKLHKKEADIVTEAGIGGVVTIATNMAGRGTDIKINKEVVSNGGLAIIGTERHDSRRVDRQLRGRSGRQGDPGSSQFYVSLEDNLMRLFGSDRVAKMMDKMGLEEGEVIQHSMMTKTIERAQKKVEENNFGIRKRLLEYDDVMNAQREVIYKRRRHSLEGDRLKVDIANMIYDTTELIVENNKTSNNYKDYEFDIIRYFSLSSEYSANDFEITNSEEIISKTYKSAYKHYNSKMVISTEKVFPVIKNVYENPANNFERIVVPFTDGKKTLNVVSDLKKAYESKGETLINDFEKNISLAIIDEAWKDHLRKMDELKQSVQLAVHEQKDPLVIYKFEAYELFKSMLGRVNKEIISFLFNGQLPSKDPSEIREDRKVRRQQKLNISKEEVLNSDEMASINRKVGQMASQRNSYVETIVREEKKIGRNEKVTIKHLTNGEIKTLKYKLAENHLKNGDWILVND